MGGSGSGADAGRRRDQRDREGRCHTDLDWCRFDDRHEESGLRRAPASFSVANPARVALDLPGAVNAVGRNLVELNQGDLRSVNIVQAQGKSRVVLNLKRPLTHAVRIEGKRMLVALGGATDTSDVPRRRPARRQQQWRKRRRRPAPQSHCRTVGAQGGRALRGVDFRRGAEGEGRVIIDLSDPNTNVDIRQQGNTVVVDFLNTTLPDTLKRRLDVSDFATPVTTSRRASRATTSVWWSSRAALGTQRLPERHPLCARGTARSRKIRQRLFQGTRQGYQGERLSLNFQNVDVRSLLQVIADFTNLNIITSDSVGGTITLRLKDVPWDQALDIILQTKGLDMRKNGNVLLVAPRDEIATKEKLELESRNQIQELEPLRSEAFVVNYQKAEEVRRLLIDDKQRLLSKRGSVAVDPRTNQMFVQDTTARLEEVRRLLQRIDIPVPQVLIEARIVEADDKFSRNLGVRFGYGRVTNEVAVGGQNVLPTLPGAGGIGGGGGIVGGVSVINSNNVNLPAAGIGGFNPGSFDLTLFNAPDALNQPGTDCARS